MARVTSIYKTLRFLVECQPPGQAFFEPIAALNSDRVAIDYAKECVKRQFEIFSSANDGKLVAFGWRYRVVERRNNEPKCIYRSDIVS